jgi:hypothetical protein
MARKKIDAQQLQEILTREFRGTAGDLCLECRIPMPKRIDSTAGGPNWRLASGGECPNLCHTILEDLVAKLGKSYELG